MKRLNRLVLLSGVAFAATLLAACGNNVKPLSEQEKTAFTLLGDSISADIQSTLLQNVAAAIQKGGTDHAVQFCNTNAIPLTDSVAQKYRKYIQRLSDKNRNPTNALKTETDMLAWEKIRAEKASFVTQVETGEVYYYKPILIAMPTCVKCHGSEADIPESTQKLIVQKYPDDKATGYTMGNLRGMWKIKL